MPVGPHARHHLLADVTLRVAEGVLDTGLVREVIRVKVESEAGNAILHPVDLGRGVTDLPTSPFPDDVEETLPECFTVRRRALDGVAPFAVLPGIVKRDRRVVLVED